MSLLEPDASFEQMWASTRDARAHVRQLVSQGTPQLAEPDANRRQSYLAKRQPGLPHATGAEALIGNTTDYQDAVFLAVGAQVRRAVAYIEINLPTEARQATGFLISDSLLITNHHVIASADEALAATVFFDRELDSTRRPLPMTAFRLEPSRFFASSPVGELDYTVVAVGERISGPAQLADFGHCPISPLGAKHVLGMNVNILQHPNGQYKQVALRNNLLTFRGQQSLLYETDTEVGSSGAPVFNDLWEVIALHHWGQAYAAAREVQNASTGPARGNEGVRISAIHESLGQLLPSLPVAAQALLQSALDAYRTLPRGVDPSHSSSSVNQPVRTQNSNGRMGQVCLRIPLEITIEVSSAGQLLSAGDVSTSAIAMTPVIATAVSPMPLRLSRAAEAVRLDIDYSNRSGYAAEFLTGLQVALPGMTAALTQQVAPLRAAEANAKAGVLKYEHFSVVMHKTRRVAIFTATNIDGDTYKNVDRATGLVGADSQEGDTWFKDTRISESYCLGQDFYSASSDYFDRGHLTRRSDPTWGTAEQAERANADTFHFTNCAPQHFRFNQSARYWQGAERYVLETGLLQATGPNARLCVLQGPIYNSAIDLWMDNQVQIPSSFWKVVVWKGARGLKAVGLVVDQLALLSETRSYLGQPKDIKQVDVAQWRVAIASIGKRAGLVFSDAIISADTIKQGVQPLPGAEAAGALRINRFEDILL